MANTFLFNLCQNLILAFALVFVMGIAWARFTKLPSLLRRSLLGFVFGLGIMAGMVLHVEFVPGIFMDSRSVLAGLAGLFAGWPGALVSGVMGGLFRLYIGGEGSVVGCWLVMLSGLVGLLFGVYLKRKQRKVTPGSLAVLGVLIAIQTTVTLLFLPKEVAWGFFKTTALPFILSFPPACVLIGWLLLREQRLRERERLLRFTKTSIDNAGEAAFWADESSKFVYVNKAAQRMLGYSRQELLSMGVGDVDKEFDMSQWPEFCRKLQEEEGVTLETTHYRKDGTEFPVEITIHALRYEGDTFICGLARDITARKQAEQQQHELELQLRQSQKMEAVGRLAGGIAHDFNNLLQVIQGNSDLAAMKIEDNQDPAENLNNLSLASKRAAALTRQLLTFSRSESYQNEVLNMNVLVDELMKMVARLIGEDVHLKIELADDLKTVCGDRGQFEQVLLNLSINARNAMSEGGTLTIQTRNIIADDKFVKAHSGATHEEYVEVMISDTGVGIPEELRDKIFEPFFTTCEVGQGTGLGLSTVYAIVQKFKGIIDFDSEVGKGTNFHVYLPVCEEQEILADKEKPAVEVRGGGETILLAEDEELVCQLAVEVLESAGYKLLVANDGQQAIDIISQQGDEIDMAILDVVMPHKGGLQVSQALQKHRQGIPTLFSSGYNETIKSGQLPPVSQVLPKPYSPEDLLVKVRQMLDESELK